MIETERLFIRKLTVEDAIFQFELMNSDGWLEFIGDRGIKTTEDATQYIVDHILKSYTENGFGSYLVLIKETQIPIGVCGVYTRKDLEVEDFGFAFLPAYTGKGYAHEAAKSVLSFIKNMGLKQLLAITTNHNNASIKLLEKLGFQYTRQIYVDQEELMLFHIDV